jgi:N-acetylglutamate synthase-like GNAT family acetyltransferase
MQPPDGYEISTDRGRLDIEVICGFLRSSYWAQGIPRSVVEKSIRNSLCFGVYCGPQQVGFARVVSDFATIAYIADVFVVPAHRGRGLAKWLTNTIVEHPELQGLRRILLATQDAHGLYAQFGFLPLSNPERFMSIHHPDVYRNRNDS